MKTYNDDGLASAIVTVQTAIIRDLMKLPPYLGVELPNVLRHLEKLQAIGEGRCAFCGYPRGGAVCQKIHP